MIDVAILIPCYNEAKTIAKVINDFKTQLPFAEIYVYDNNSTDDTVKIAKKNGAFVRHCYQQGKGNVVRQMFFEIDANCYIIVDGDDTYDASNVKEMVDLVLLKQVDMVVGDRLSSTYFNENKRLFHSQGNKLVRKLINVLFKADIKDVMSGYRVLSYRFVKTFPVLTKGFEIETEMTIHAVDKNLSIKHVVCSYRDRPKDSKSKLRTIPDGCCVLKTIIMMCSTYKPFQFFGAISLILFLLGVGFFLPIFADYLISGVVQNFPTLIMCCCVWMISIQSLFSGLILDAFHKKIRQDFEYKLGRMIEQKKELNKKI